MLLATINQEKITAMKAGNKFRRDTLTLVQAAIKQVEVDTRAVPDDAAIIGILGKMIKQRQDSITQYEANGRTEAAQLEKDETVIIQEFLPAQASDEEIDALVAKTIESVGAVTIRDLGKVMGALKAELNGKADMGKVGQKAKALLGG